MTSFPYVPISKLLTSSPLNLMTKMKTVLQKWSLCDLQKYLNQISSIENMTPGGVVCFPYIPLLVAFNIIFERMARIETIWLECSLSDFFQN